MKMKNFFFPFSTEQFSQSEVPFGEDGRTGDEDWIGGDPPRRMDQRLRSRPDQGRRRYDF